MPKRRTELANMCYKWKTHSLILIDWKPVRMIVLQKQHLNKDFNVTFDLITLLTLC